MKTPTKIFPVLLVLLILVSCRPKADKPESENSNAEKIKQNAEVYLKPLLHIGESLTNVVERFGSPQDKSETQNNELRLDFLFLDNNQAAQAAGVGGFSAFFVSNRLAHWIPIYESRNPKFESSSIKHPSTSFRSDNGVFAFFLVSEEQKTGWNYIDDRNFPKLGYINESPDLVIFSGQYTTYDSAQNSRHAIELVLSQADGEKLKKLTSENVGKQLALLVGSQVVLAPYIREPTSDGEIMLELPDSPYSILLKTLKAHSLPVGAN